MKKLLSGITKELAKGNVRRAVPSLSIPREIWLMMLRPRNPDIHETNRPTVTEGDLNHKMLHKVQRAVITNECPWCRSIFSTRPDAQHHARSLNFTTVVLRWFVG